MIRQITNWCAGRKKITDENLDYKEFYKMLSDLHPNTWVKISDYTHGAGDRTLKETLIMVDEHFKPSEYNRGYIDINHKVYSNNKLNKHYLDLIKGPIGSGLCQHTNQVLSWRNAPSCKATLEFEVIKN